MRYHNQMGFYDIICPFLGVVCLVLSVFIFSQEIIFEDTINLNDYMNSSSYDDSKFPSNGRATVEITECYGSFYTKRYNSSRGIRPFDYYFVVKLEDDSIIAIQTDSWRVGKFDKLTNATLYSGSNISIKHEGYIGGFSGSEYEIKKSYTEYVDNLIVNKIIPKNSNVRYLVISNFSRLEALKFTFMFFLFGLFFSLPLICYIYKNKKTNYVVTNDSEFSENKMRDLVNSIPEKSSKGSSIKELKRLSELKELDQKMEALRDSRDQTTRKDRKRIYELLKDDRKIEAIDLYRKISGADLAEAKKAIEVYQELIK